jgi:hypothetical protein
MARAMWGRSVVIRVGSSAVVPVRAWLAAMRARPSGVVSSLNMMPPPPLTCRSM